MEALIPNQNSKTIEYEGNKYYCKFQIIGEESIDVSIFLFDSLKFKGNITLEKIKMKIFYFSENNIKEIYEEIIQLKFDNFSIIKENDKYKLKIKIIILKKEYYLLIDLLENKDKDKNLINNDIINYYENIIKEKDNTISKLKEIIKFKDEKINSLREQLKSIQNKNFEDIQINLNSFKNELKIKNEKEEKENNEKEEEERKKKEKREIEEEERKKREKENREKEKREKEEEEERNKKENIDKELFKNNNNNRTFLKLAPFKKEIQFENLYYSYECINIIDLTTYIYEKTKTAKIKITLKNDGTLDWPENDTKLIFEEKSKVKGEEIILKPQEKGSELNYEIIFNNLEKLTEGEYQSYANIIIKGDQIGEKLILKIKIKKKENPYDEMNKYMDKIESLRTEYGLDENDFPNERVFKALKENDFDFDQAFASLYE